MMKKLINIAQITTGVYAKASLSGSLHFLQGKHFDEFGKFRTDMYLAPNLHDAPRLQKHLLQDGDLLIMSKGSYNKACLYQHNMGRAVASSTFFVVRLLPDRIPLLPTYLQWYFNHPRTQAYLAHLSKGSNIHSLAKSDLQELKISIPSIEKQSEILTIQKCWEKEKKIMTELMQQKAILYQNLLLNATKSTF